MADDDVFGRINALSDEEERLWRNAGDGQGLTAEDQDRLEIIKVELDRCYDLLHQREARRAAGLDPRRGGGPARGRRGALPAVAGSAAQASGSAAAETRRAARRAASPVRGPRTSAARKNPVSTSTIAGPDATFR